MEKAQKASGESRDQQILFTVGSGGVGKTTFSASLAARAAIEGRNVFVLTIDPSQRLKTTLKLDESGEVSRLSHPDFKGTLEACILNSKKTFDDFITEATGRPGAVDRILKNHLYQQLSTHLAGSQEFTSLERIFQAKRSNKYDLIIVDTPPTEHALDFLESPQKLLRLFRGSMMKWFQKKESVGILGGIFQFGTKKVLSSLEFLTGSQFMNELSDFFSQLQAWQPQLEKRMIDYQNLLTDRATNFLLVSALDEEKIPEIQYFYDALLKSGHHLHKLVVNRAHPPWFESHFKQDLEKAPEDEKQLIEKYAGNIDKKKSRYFQLLQTRLPNVEILQIAEAAEPISDLDGVVQFSQKLKGIL